MTTHAISDWLVIVDVILAFIAGIIWGAIMFWDFSRKRR
jgi:hypothetical protein